MGSEARTAPTGSAPEVAEKGTGTSLEDGTKPAELIERRSDAGDVDDLGEACAAWRAAAPSTDGAKKGTPSCASLKDEARADDLSASVRPVPVGVGALSSEGGLDGPAAEAELSSAGPDAKGRSSSEPEPNSEELVADVDRVLAAEVAGECVDEWASGSDR